MNFKKIGLGELRELDILNEKIEVLEKAKQSVHQKIRLIKSSIAIENQDYLGKKAICEIRESSGTTKDVLAICNQIDVLDDFETAFRFEYNNGKKVSYESFRWS